MSDKHPIGSVAAFLKHRQEGAERLERLRLDPKIDTSFIPSARVTEFTSVSQHLDDDLVELLLLKAKQRAEIFYLTEEVEKCKNCSALGLKLIIP